MNKSSTWALISLVCAGSVTVALSTAGSTPIVGEPTLAWGWMVVAAAVVELGTIRFRYRRERSSLTFFSVVATVGVLHGDPVAVMAGAAAAAAVDAALDRSRRPTAVALGAAQYLARGTTVVAVATWLTSPGAASLSTSWIQIAVTVAAAELAAELVGSGGRLLGGSRRSLNALAGRGALTAFGSALLAPTAICVTILIETEPFAGLLAFAPLAAVSIADFAMRRENEQGNTRRFLTTTPGTVTTPPQNDPIAELVRATEEDLGAVSVELVRFDPTAPTSKATRCMAGRVVEEQLDTATTLLLRQLARDVGDLARLDATQTGSLANLQGANAVSALVGAISRAGEPAALLVAAGGIASFGVQANDAIADFSRHRHRIQTALVKEKIRIESSRDPLTGLPTQEAFGDRTRTALDSSGSVAALRIDLDDFALVNDALGHAAGDAILSVISVRIRRCLGPDDIAARFDGDEFGVLLVGSSDPVEVATRIVDEVHQPITIAGQNVSVAISVGISRADVDSSPTDLLSHADSAMRQAKERGKGIVAVFGSDEAVASRGPLKTSLAKALEDDGDRLSVAYQPIHAIEAVDESGEVTSAGAVIGFEALARWASADSATPEGTFIEQAEAEGVIGVVDSRVFDRVFENLAGLLAGSGAEFVAVNISPLTLADTTLAERLAEAAERAGVDRSSVVVEVSERTIVEQPSMTVGRLRDLNRAGFACSIDGFGSGGASFAVLKQTAARFVKLSAGLVERVEEDPDSLATVVDLAQSLGFEVIAHGVETQTQLEAVTQLGCDHAQGYLLGRPEPITSQTYSTICS